MSYLNQLKAHRASLELTIKQCDNDIAHYNKCIDLLEQQKETIKKQVEYIDESIAEEENKQP
jgi:transcription elongation factor Elf1